MEIVLDRTAPEAPKSPALQADRLLVVDNTPAQRDDGDDFDRLGRPGRRTAHRRVHAS